ncbi:MAG: metallophosphoesterase family protein, partial [Promethearchaeota archaeon]
DKLGKILIVSDVHAKIPEMIDFFNIMLEKGDEIDFAVHLGDFWSGRNFDPKKGSQFKDEWHDLIYFERLPFPLYHLRGNEDLTQPDSWWTIPNTCLMADQLPFYLNDWKILPLDYQYRGEPADEIPKHPEYSKETGFDFIFSHRPPLGLLDDTLHFKTHQKLSGTGSPMIRKYYDKICPSLFIFGHFHYSNFLQTDCGLIACLDKLIRIGGRNHDEFKYSYALLDPFDQSLEIFWKNRQFIKYSILEQKILVLNRFDKRNLYQKKSRMFKKRDRN